MSSGTIYFIVGIGLAIGSTVVYILMRMWVYNYGKRVKEEMRTKYGCYNK